MYFLEVTKLNFDSSDGLTERISVSLVHVHVYCYNEYQNHRSHTLKILATTQLMSQVFTQVHHKTRRVLNEFAKRTKISNKTILLFLNLPEMLSLTSQTSRRLLEEKAPVNNFGRRVPSGEEYGCS